MLLALLIVGESIQSSEIVSTVLLGQGIESAYQVSCDFFPNLFFFILGYLNLHSYIERGSSRKILFRDLKFLHVDVLYGVFYHNVGSGFHITEVLNLTVISFSIIMWSKNYRAWFLFFMRSCRYVCMIHNELCLNIFQIKFLLNIKLLYYVGVYYYTFGNFRILFFFVSSFLLVLIFLVVLGLIFLNFLILILHFYQKQHS